MKGIYKNMRNEKRMIRLHRKVYENESMEERHEKIMKGLSVLEAPLGLKDSEIPKTPDFGVNTLASYFTKNIRTKGVLIHGDYLWRDDYAIKHGWDILFYEFKSSYKLINYEKIIFEDLPKVIEIFDPYIADVYIPYVGAHEEGTTPETRLYLYNQPTKNLDFNKLFEQGIRPNELGVNLFTLLPVMYFSDLMCDEVIKLSRNEIIKRLTGKVVKIESLKNGVYIIFNEKLEFPFEEFCEMNKKYKPLLDLI